MPFVLISLYLERGFFWLRNTRCEKFPVLGHVRLLTIYFHNFETNKKHPEVI